MLNQIRSATNSIVFRLVIGVIVIAFAFWGVKDLRRSAEEELVTFNTVEPITLHQYEIRKSQERSRLQRVSGTILTEEEVRNSGLAQYIMDKMVTERLLQVAANDYGIEISDKMLMGYIRNLPMFQNEDGFSSQIFSNVITNSGMTEEDYIKDIKDKMKQNILVNTFMSSYIIPKKMLGDIISYMSEVREVDVAILDLKKEKVKTKISPSDEQLKAFYAENSNQFMLPEKRSVRYIILDKNKLGSEIKISEKDVEQYYEDNKDDFAALSAMKAKNKIHDILLGEKSEELMMNYAKNLEDDVAGGANIKEIAEKYKLKVFDKNLSTMADLEESNMLQIAAGNIFSMDKGEVSYPFDNGKELLLAELDDIEQQHIEDFNKVSEQVKEKYLLAEIANLSLKKGHEMVDQNNDSVKNEVQKNGYKLNKYELSRGDKKDLPEDLIINIFNLSAQSPNSVPVISNDKIYIAFLNKVKVDNKQAKQIAKNNSNAISNKIKEGVFIQLIKFYRDKEEVKVYQ